MRYASSIAAIFVALPVHAADLGKPATLEDIIALRAKDQSATCYVESSVSGTFLRNDRQAQAGFGGGCDIKLANLLIGGGLRADFADWRDNGSVFVKIGMVINSGADIYGTAGYKIAGWKLKDAGQLMLGAGAELKLEIVNPNLWVFGEAAIAATKFGAAVEKDEIETKIGLRYKF